MNKNLILIVAALVLGLSGVSCSKSSKPSPGKLDQVSTFKTPAGPVVLKAKWPTGERVVQSLDLKQNMEITVPNQPQPIKQDVTMGQEYGLTVLKENPDGGHEVELEFLNARMAAMQGGQTVFSYDSTKKAAADNANPALAAAQQTVAAMFQNIIGSKVQFFLDASNQVERVEGLDTLTSKLGPGGQNDATASIKHIFSKNYLTQMLGGSQYLPSKPVQPGDTWPLQVEYEVEQLGTLVIDISTTFVNWETHGKRTCARLEFQGTFKTKPGQKPASTGMTMDIQEGNSSGVTWFDPELGKVIETIANQDIKMAMTMTTTRPGFPKGGVTQSLDMLLKQVVTTKLESVK
jgi:hypothetical protein